MIDICAFTLPIILGRCLSCCECKFDAVEELISTQHQHTLRRGPVPDSIQYGEAYDLIETWNISRSQDLVVLRFLSCISTGLTTAWA